MANGQIPMTNQWPIPKPQESVSEVFVAWLRFAVVNSGQRPSTVVNGGKRKHPLTNLRQPINAAAIFP
jgi:hypothetical protein